MASNNRSIYSHSSGGEKPRIQFLAGLCFLWSSRKQSFLASSGFWWLLPFLFCGFISSVSACVFMWLPPLLPVCLSSVCVCLSLFFFYFTILYWFCHTSTWIHHGCTCVPNPEPPLPPPSPYHPSGSSQCTSPKLPVSCIKPGLPISFLHDIIHVSMPFSQIIPPSSLSHRVQKTVLYISVSFAVSHTGLSLPSF